MKVGRNWLLGLVACLSVANPVAARSVITNDWSNVPNSTNSGNTITLNDASPSPQPRLLGSIVFSPGATSIPYSLQSLGGLIGYCWGTATAGDGCDGSSNSLIQVVVQPLSYDVEGRVTDFVIYFGYGVESCPTQTATLTVAGVTYEATNPCALSANAFFGGDAQIVTPADTGALEFLGGTLVNPQNYLGHGWAIKSGTARTPIQTPSPADLENVAVGPNANGSVAGDPWILGKTLVTGGYSINHLEKGNWARKPGGAIGIAVSPQGSPWIVDNAGGVWSWNGTTFVQDTTAPCATWIGVGPNAYGLRNGDPWIIGCTSNPAGGGFNIYQRLSTRWVFRSGAGLRLAVSPQGFPWVINSNGAVFYWNGNSFVAAPATPPCASDIAVGPTLSTANTGNAAPFRFGDVWIMGCTADADNNYVLYQLQDDPQFGLSWIAMGSNQPQNGTPVTMGVQIAVSPDLGIPWIYNADGTLYQ